MTYFQRFKILCNDTRKINVLLLRTCTITIQLLYNNCKSALPNEFSAMSIKESLTRDFRFQVFFMKQCPPGPQVFHWGRFEFF
jgi:hypothetical protein